jgi:branched-chain amino acid aminotransferase
METIVYLNGALIPLNNARVSILDNGFLFGYGIFGVMRIYEGKTFRLGNQLSRLTGSAARLRIAVDIERLPAAVKQIIEVNNLHNGQVRITVSAGEGSLIPDPRGCTKPTVAIVGTEYIPPAKDAYEKGYRAIVSSIRRHEGSPVSEMKTLNYLESLLARQEARMTDFNEAILLNEQGNIAESSSGNVFLVKNGTFKTPRANNGLIPGIAREVILEAIPQFQLSAEETDLTLDDLLAADEAFLTNSMIEVMPLVSINNRTIGSGRPGELTRKMMQVYRERVIRELE